MIEKIEGTAESDSPRKLEWLGLLKSCTVWALAVKFSSAGFNNLSMSGYLSQLESVYQSTSAENASLTVAKFSILLKYWSSGRPYFQSYPVDPASYPTAGVIEGPSHKTCKTSGDISQGYSKPYSFLL